MVYKKAEDKITRYVLRTPLSQIKQICQKERQKDDFVQQKKRVK